MVDWRVMRLTFGLALVAGVLASGLYVGALDAEFVYDDIVYIVNNAQVQNPGDCFLTPFPPHLGDGRGLYRPMLTASLALDFAIFGMEPWGFHLTNILLHGLCTLIFFFVLRLFTTGHTIPFIGALFFSFHPARTEAAVWAVGRAELLCAVGCLAALLLYVKWLKNRRSQILIAGSLLCFVIGALSKEIGLAFPGLLFAYEFLINRSDSLRGRIFRLFPFVVTLAALIGLRIAILGTGASLQESSQVLSGIQYPERLVLAGNLLSKYLFLTVWPHPLLPNHQPISFVDPTIAGCIPTLVFLAALLFACFKARRWAFAGALFLVPLIPVLNLIPIGEALAERFLYLPLAGGAMAFTLLIEKFVTNKQTRPAVAFSVVILLPLAWIAVKQTEVWTNSLTLWSHVYEITPENPRAPMSIGMHLLEEGKIEGEEGALAYFQKTEDANPNYRPERLNFKRAQAYEKLSRLPEAMERYRLALEHQPHYSEALLSALELNKNPELDESSRLPREVQARYLQRLLKFAPTKKMKSQFQQRYGVKEE